MQFGTNHLGHFALTNLLLPHVDRSRRHGVLGRPPHRPHRPRRPQLGAPPLLGRGGAYGQSKLANLLFTFELERRLVAHGSTVRAVAAHPGYAATNLQSHTGDPLSRFVMAVANRTVAQSDEMGALPTLYAATQDVPGGSYVGPDGFQEARGYPTLVGCSAAASDPQMAARLWAASEELTGTPFPSAPTG